MSRRSKAVSLPDLFSDVIKASVAVNALGIAAVALPATAMAQAAADSTALREYVEAYQRAWDRHDAAAVATFFSEGADLVMGNLPAVRGRRAIEEWWRTYFERQEPERQGTFEVISARLLTPKVALLNVASTTGGEASGSEPLPVRKARGTWLLRREGGDWRIEAMRGLPTEEDRVELTPTLGTEEALRPQIRAFLAAYEDAFDRHDPDALSAFYRDDADIIVRNLSVTHGARAIRMWWKDYFSQPRPYRVVLIIEEIRMLAEDVALLNLIATGAALEPKEQPMPLRQARATWILVREDGKWLIAALRVLPSEADRIIRESGR